MAAVANNRIREDGYLVQASRQQFLTFELEDEQYGVNILSVQEIKGWEGVRHMPEMPTYIVGVIDLRGIIVPIMDLRLRFGMQARPCSSTTVVIIVATKHDDEVVPMGLVVDAVSDVLEISGNGIKPVPSVGDDKRGKFVSGLVSQTNRMVIMLDIEKLLIEKTVV